MSSFEHFKKSQHSHKSNRSDSRLSFKSFEADLPNLANLSFNTAEIIFRMREGAEALTNQDLRVANRTGTRLYYQVTALHPQYFDIRPREDILEVNAVASLTIRLNQKRIVEESRSAGTPLQKVAAFLANNAIEFAWGEITEQNIKYNEIPRTNNRQLLKVRVQGNERTIQRIEIQPSPRNASLTKPYNTQISAKENRIMGEPKGFDSSGSKAILQSEQGGEYSSLLTIPIIAAVAFCSFVVGFASA